MTRLIIITIAILLTNTYYGVAQTYFVNDIVPEVKLEEVMQTKTIPGPKIVFIEKDFTLKVSKDELIKTLKVEGPEWGKEFDTIFNIVINYVSSTDNLTFKYAWKDSEELEGISWFETDKLGARNLTIMILQRTMCTLIEQGNIELFQANKKQNKFFIGLVNTPYGKNAKGVFTSTKRLIWICPPWVSCALPRF